MEHDRSVVYAFVARRVAEIVGADSMLYAALHRAEQGSGGANSGTGVGTTSGKSLEAFFRLSNMLSEDQRNALRRVIDKRQAELLEKLLEVQGGLELSQTVWRFPPSLYAEMATATAMDEARSLIIQRRELDRFITGLRK